MSSIDLQKWANIATIIGTVIALVGIGVPVMIWRKSHSSKTGTSEEKSSSNKTSEDKLSYEKALAELSKVDADLPHKLRLFINRCKREGFFEDVKKTIMIKAEVPGIPAVNFGTIGIPDGKLDTNYIAESGDKVGNRDIAVKYLQGIANLLEGAIIDSSGKPWTWRVRLHGDLPPLSKLLEKEDEWLELMKETRSAFLNMARLRTQNS